MRFLAWLRGFVFGEPAVVARPFAGDVWCPMCGALPGAACRSIRGDVLDYFHHARDLERARVP